MREEIEIRVELPVDDDGYLRRACAHCEREFKWKYSEPDPDADGDVDQSHKQPEGGYFCPYCGAQSDEWLTTVQREWVVAQATNEVAGPLVKDMDKRFRASSSGLIQASIQWTPAKAEQPLEINDMKRVDFACHPQEPVKVLDGWSKPVHCLICGEPA